MFVCVHVVVCVREFVGWRASEEAMYSPTSPTCDCVYMCVCAYVCIRVFVCVCVCVDA